MTDVPNTPRIPDSVGYYLAGLTDGEGHFGISKNTRRGRNHHGCLFIINMRLDDLPLLEWLHEQTGGLGSIGRNQGLRQRQGWETRPVAAWRVYSKAECLELVHIFEEYPLHSKKARDFTIWAQAVRYLNGPQPEGIAPMARWFEEIRLVRAYVEGESPDFTYEDELAALSLFDEVDE